MVREIEKMDQKKLQTHIERARHPAHRELFGPGLIPNPVVGDEEDRNDSTRKPSDTTG